MIRGTDNQEADTGEVVALNAIQRTRDIAVGDPNTTGHNELYTSMTPPAVPEMEAITIDSAPPATPSRMEPLPIVGGVIIPLPAGVLVNGGGGEPVPEPATMLVLGAGAAAVAMRKRRKAKS